MSRILCNRGWIDLDAEVIDPGMIDDRWAFGVLARANRYAGQPPSTWSVRQHSFLVCDIAEKLLPGAGPWGLYHDLHEAYFGDVINPLMRFMGPEFTAKLEALRHRFDVAIWRATGLDPNDEVRRVVKTADRIAYEVEWRSFAELWPDHYGASVAEIFEGERHPLVAELLPLVVPWICGAERPSETVEVQT